MTSLSIIPNPMNQALRPRFWRVERPLWLSSARRDNRVAIALIVVAALSAVDLVMTLRCMTGPGMFEANPIVVQLVRMTASPVAVACFKALTVLVGSAMLFRLRRHAQAELASWLIVVVLTALAIRWIRYASVASGLMMAMTNDPAWVQMP